MLAPVTEDHPVQGQVASRFFTFKAKFHCVCSASSIVCREATVKARGVPPALILLSAFPVGGFGNKKEIIPLSLLQKKKRKGLGMLGDT